jgi:predicted nucleotidyltransferase
METLTLNKIKEILAKYRPELKRKFKVKEIGVFGSYIKGGQKEKSDIDILVEFEDDAKLSLLDVAGLEIELSELLGAKVDLVEKKCLKPFLGKHILKEVVYI